MPAIISGYPEPEGSIAARVSPEANPAPDPPQTFVIREKEPSDARRNSQILPVESATSTSGFPSPLASATVIPVAPGTAVPRRFDVKEDEEYGCEGEPV